MNREEFESLLKEYIVFREQHGMLAKDIVKFVADYIEKELEKAKAEAKIEAYKKMHHRINCDTLISELYGWKNVLDRVYDYLTSEAKQQIERGAE